MSVKIYVGNLSYDVDDSALYELFSPHGQVEKAEVVIDRESSRSKGFGFVEMPNEEEARKGIEALDGHEAFGRSLRVNEARSASSAGSRSPRGRATESFLRKYRPDDVPSGYVPRTPRSKRGRN